MDKMYMMVFVVLVSLADNSNSADCTCTYDFFGHYETECSTDRTCCFSAPDKELRCRSSSCGFQEWEGSCIYKHGMIAGIVIGVVVFIALIVLCVVCCCKGCQRAGNIRRFQRPIIFTAGGRRPPGGGPEVQHPYNGPPPSAYPATSQPAYPPADPSYPPPTQPLYPPSTQQPYPPASDPYYPPYGQPDTTQNNQYAGAGAPPPTYDQVTKG